jgi:hypothetical protein
MQRKIGFGLLWLAFAIYAFGFAPPDRPDTFDLIKDLLNFQIAGINPLIVALFNLLGLLPLLYCCFLFFDGSGQRVRAWWFVLGSFGVGAFALLPYLTLREPNPTFIGKKTGLLKLFDSRLVILPLVLAVLGLLIYGISQADWVDFWQQWQTSRFIHVMSLDFCLMSLLFPALLGDDMTRRGLQNNRLFWGVSLVPLLGTLAYLVFRPAIAESVPVNDATAVSEGH